MDKNYCVMYNLQSHGLDPIKSESDNTKGVLYIIFVKEQIFPMVLSK